MNETSTERKHRMMVIDLCKPADEVNMTHQDINLMHAALGIAGEGGEVVDLIKKHVINTRAGATRPNINVTEVMKELGDLEWYLTLLRTTLGIDRDVVLQMNIEKLRKRYLDGYSDQASADRVDIVTNNAIPQVSLMACMLCNKAKTQTPDGICSTCKSEMPDEAA